MVSKRRLWQLKRFKTGHGREKALGWRVQTLSLQGPGWAHSEVTALFPIYTVTSPWRRDPGGCLGHVNTRPPQRRKDPLLLSSHIHLPLDWNSFILFKWFILFHWDLISKAVPSAKRLCQQVSNHFFFFSPFLADESFRFGICQDFSINKYFSLHEVLCWPKASFGFFLKMFSFWPAWYLPKASIALTFERILQDGLFSLWGNCKSGMWNDLSKAYSKQPDLGTFPAVQSLRLCLPMQEVWIWSLLGKLRSYLSLGQETKP